MIRFFVLVPLVVLTTFSAALVLAGANLLAGLAGGHGALTMCLALVLVLVLTPTRALGTQQLALAAAAAIFQGVATALIVRTYPDLPAVQQSAAAISAGVLISALLWRLSGGIVTGVTMLQVGAFHMAIVALLTAMQYGAAPSILTDDKRLFLVFPIAWGFVGIVSWRD